MRTMFRIVRTVSAITLFFFCWTYLSVYQVVAFAAEEQRASQLKRPEFADGGKHSREGRFEETLDSMRANIARAQEKIARGEDAALEVEAIKTSKISMESQDVEFKKEFAETEKKLKDANLPQEILHRHLQFVKQYESNLKELKANIDGIDKSVTKTERQSKIEKTKLHLEKVRHQKKEVALDPNKLPHRAVKAKERAPRVKKEEFEKEFGPLVSGKPVLALNSSAWMAAQQRHTRTLLAFNGPDSDVPLATKSGGMFEDIAFDPALVAFASSPLLLAQTAPNMPTAADLAETIEVQFTPAIKAKALELGYNPVKIYEWVRNTIEFVPTYGSIQGADMCLQTKQCNAFDTSSLLIALLRASNIPAKYAYGTIEVPIDKVMNWVGGVTDPKTAGSIIATNGIPAMSIVSGGVVQAVQLEHVWVKAWIDYLPSRGVKNTQGDTWIPLEPSFKQYEYTAGLDTKSSVPFNAESFVNQLKAGATINETEGYATNMDPLVVKQAMVDYELRMKDYLTKTRPNATVGDVFGKKSIIPKDFPYLLGTLPYRLVQAGAEFAQVPSIYRAAVTFSISDIYDFEVGMTYTAAVPSLAGKKITLSYEPASANDAAVLKSYGGDITRVPAYLLTLRPVLRVGGFSVAQGPSLQLGDDHNFTMTFYEPGWGYDRVDNILNSGGYSAIVLETQRYVYSFLETKAATFKATLEAVKAQLDNGQIPSTERESLIGDWLWLQGLYYFYNQGKMLGLVELLSGISAQKGVSEAITSALPNVSYLFSMPSRVSLNAYGIDVDRDTYSAVSKTGKKEDVKQFMMMSGFIGSSLEHFHAEAVMRTPALSAISILNEANRTGIPIYTITKDNMNSILPRLQVSSAVVSDIINAINAGKRVTVPQRQLTLFEWTGVGYIVLDPETGAAAYRISGGANGGYNALLSCLKDILLTLYGVYGAASVGGQVLIGLLAWAGYYMDTAFGINWSSDSILGAILDVLLFIFIVLLALVAAYLTIIIGIGGYMILALVLGLLFGFMFNYINLAINAQETGQPAPPMWCALPCAPAIADAYHYWFDSGSNYQSPCY